MLGRSEGAVRVLIHRALRTVAARPRRASAGDRRSARDGGEIEALVTDRYLESLLTSRLDDATPATLGRRSPPASSRRCASRRRAWPATLPRFHPSFRFEERLALNLAEIAASMRVQHAAGGEGTVVPFAAPGDVGGDPSTRATTLSTGRSTNVPTASGRC